MNAPACIVSNPHFGMGTMIARAIICIGTLVWAVLVVLDPESLIRTAFGKSITQYLPAKWYGWFYLLLTATLLVRLIRRSPPHWLSATGYLVLVCSWNFVLWYILFALRPLSPTAAGSIVVAALVSVWACAPNARLRHATAGQ